MGPFSASCNDDFTVLGAWLTIAKALAVLGVGWRCLWCWPWC